MKYITMYFNLDFVEKWLDVEEGQKMLFLDAKLSMNNMYHKINHMEDDIQREVYVTKLSKVFE